MNIVRSSCRFFVALACAWAPSNAGGAPVFWDDGPGVNDRWTNPQNWNPDGEPASTSDVTLGIYLETIRIEAEGSASLTSFPPPTHYFFNDPHLTANSLTIATTTPFTLDGALTIDGWLGGDFYTSLTLTSGNLTRQDVAGIEGDQNLAVAVKLANDGVWDVAGSGVLSVAGITESNGVHAFTKTGPATLASFVSLGGPKNINQGTFQGGFGGTGAATIARGATFRVNGGTYSPVIVNGSGSGAISVGNVGIGTGEIREPLTIADNPIISVETGGTLLLSGGISSVNNSGFQLFGGAGELRLSGPGTGSILADLRGGQLTIAHNNALGTGSIFAQNALGGISILAFADGVTFANPITLLQGTIRGLGYSVVSSNISLSNLFGGNQTIDVAAAANLLSFTGSITDFGGGASLTKIGAGTVLLMGNNTITGGVTVSQGALGNHGTIAGGATNVTGNALLIGGGRFADVHIRDNGHFSPGGSTSPSVYSPATVEVKDLDFGPTTELYIQLSGGAPGNLYDQVHATGALALGGTLKIDFFGGLFPPRFGDSFDILNWDSLSGVFSAIQLPTLVGGLTWDVSQLYTTGVLSIVSPGVAGDYNSNGVVDAADYVLWRKNNNTATTLPNDSTPGTNQSDYSVWRGHFGQTAGSGSAASAYAAVPEPGTLLLLLAGMLASLNCQRRVASTARSYAARIDRRLFNVILTLIAVLTTTAPALAVTISTVPVGDAGNANDLADGDSGTHGVQNYGAVPYVFNIATREVTASQYVEFLNAKDVTGANALSLYSTNMSDPAWGEISLTPVNANGSKYGIIAGRGQHPANYITWYDSIRFANWVNNGQGGASTETGAYTLGALGAGAIPITPPLTHNAGAKVWLPTENEWYKAAYYNPTSSSYFRYPTSSDLQPTASGPTALANHANFFPGGAGDITDVGAFSGTISPYGALDMGGNVYQWNESLIGSPNRRIVRGGSWADPVEGLLSSSRFDGIPANAEFVTSFRVASSVTSIISGDYNFNGMVDAADYVLWRKTDGSQNGYTAWRANFGAGLGSGTVVGANAAVPEPASVALLILTAASLYPRRHRCVSLFQKLVKL